MRIFDIHYAYNLLMILMYCIIDIQPNDFPKFSAAALYYMKFFVNCQINNAEYFSNVYGNKSRHNGIH